MDVSFVDVAPFKKEKHLKSQIDQSQAIIKWQSS